MAQTNEPKKSDLCQSVTRSGQTVQIEIYQDENNGWILEVVDEYWNSTVWEDTFSTDQNALDEALKSIQEEGIGSFIGTQSASG